MGKKADHEMKLTVKEIEEKEGKEFHSSSSVPDRSANSYSLGRCLTILFSLGL